MTNYIKIINGDLLLAKEKYIIHQCNCITSNPGTLAKDLFNKFPYANTYKFRKRFDKTTFDIPGSIDIMGDGKKERYIINLYSQIYPSKPRSYEDSFENRVTYFREGLDKISQIKNITSIAMPYNIGCGIAGGDWNLYYKEIENFADKIKLPVILYKFP